MLRYALLAVLVTGVIGAAEESDAPTPEETLLLEFVNRFRADPAGDAQRIVDYVKSSDRWMLEHVDLDMFLKETREIKPVPPLVFNRELIASARGHCRYMILNDLTHDQAINKPGFTGRSFTERIKAAKFPGLARAENVYRDAIGVWDGHLGFVIDHGDGPGGMQKDRGHRKILSMWDLKEIGIGIVTHGEEKFSITQDFGERQQVIRRVGGVAYVDLNGNGFYDIGECVGGVKITASTGGSVLTWPSGAYELDLRSDQAVTLTAEFGGKSITRDEKPGRSNIKFDWIMPSESANALADRLLKNVDAARAGSAERDAANVELYVNAKTLPLDEARRAKIQEALKDFEAGLELHRKAVRDLLDGEEEAFAKLVAEERKPYAKTPLDDWFAQALKVNAACRSLNELERLAKAKRLSDRDKHVLMTDVEAALRRVSVQEFKDYLDQRIAKIGQ